MNPDDDLRRLLDDATADIHPQGTYEEILARTGSHDRGARRWFLPVVAAAAVVGVVAGAALYANRSDAPVPAGPSQDPTAARTVSEAHVYYAGTSSVGHSLFVESREFDDVSDLPTTAVQAAVSGPARDPDYTTLWPSGVTVRKVGYAGGAEPAITIDLSGVDAARAVDPRDGLLAVEAAVRTAQDAFGTRAPVWFTDGGQRLSALFGNPAGTSGYGAGDDDTVMSPVQVENPADGADLPAGDVLVTGVAAAFEANVVWELKAGAGDTVVEHGHATAAECCTLSPYSFTIHGVAPGTYTLVVHDTDESGQSRAVDQDTKEIVVG
jgi:hypothetical protein